LFDELSVVEKGRVPSGTIVEVQGDIPVGMKLKLGDFAKAISTRIWEKVGQENWRSFCEARDFVRGLGLRSQVEWWKWTTGQLRRPDLPKRPPDIPSAPDGLYVSEWKDWADWLGHTRRMGGWRSFEKARKFARDLSLKSRSEWALWRAAEVCRRIFRHTPATSTKSGLDGGTG
jgi:hypothetical protein